MCACDIHCVLFVVVVYITIKIYSGRGHVWRQSICCSLMLYGCHVWYIYMYKAMGTDTYVLAKMFVLKRNGHIPVAREKCALYTFALYIRLVVVYEVYMLQ